MQQTYEGMDHRVTVVRVRNGQMLETATEFVHGLDVFQSGPSAFGLPHKDAYSRARKIMGYSRQAHSGSGHRLELRNPRVPYPDLVQAGKGLGW